MPEEKRIIDVVSDVDRKHGYAPVVMLTWGPMKGVLTPNEARVHALSLLRAAESAETDAFLMQFTTGPAEYPEATALEMIGAFKGWRMAQEEGHEEGHD